MLKAALIICCLLSINIATSLGQDANSFYLQGIEKANSGNFEEAAILFTKTIELQPENYYAWYNRGISKSKLNLYEEALPDFEETIKLFPTYTKAFLNRGITKKHLTDYDGALRDYNYCILLEPENADAYFNRGLLYELLNKKDSSCLDFHTAKKLGSKNIEAKIDKCNDTSKSTIEIHSILRLTKTADNNKYGFTGENPIKVGCGPNGGPANQRTYLELLRDPQGKPIKYERKGSCCPYKSTNDIFGLGMGMVDMYQINFLNINGTEEKKIIYISFDDFEEPLIPYGFKTIRPK